MTTTLHTTLRGTLIATAVGGLLACASTKPAQTTAANLDRSDHAPVKCEGTNDCKGQSQCASNSNHCAGQNSCKGHGWTKVARAECMAKHGMVRE